MAVVDELVAILGFEIEGEANARRFEKQIGRLDGKIRKFAGGIAKFGVAATTVAASATAALGKMVIDTSAEFEAYQATLETVEGTNERAKQSMDWITEFTRTTPYKLDGVARAFVQLKAYGIDPITNDALRVLGDTAAAMNKPLMQAVEAFADASTGEFERLKEFGIRAKQAGEEVTFSWTKDGKTLTKTVRKNGEEIRSFLLETLGDRFNGAMFRQSKTWNGMMSNLGDSWTIFKKKIGDKGFFETVKGHLGRLLDKMGELDKNGTLDTWAGKLSTGLNAAVKGVTGIAKRLGKHFETASKRWAKFKPVIIGIGIAFGVLLAYLFPVAALLVAVVAGIGLAFDQLLEFWAEGGGTVGDFFKKYWEKIKIGWEKVKPKLIETGRKLWGWITETLPEKWKEAKAKVAQLWDNLKDRISRGWKKNKPKLKKLGKKLWGWITDKDTLRSGWNAVKSKVTDFWKNYWNLVSTPLKAAGRGIKDHAPDIAERLAKGFNDIDFGEVVDNVFDGIGNAFKNAPKTWSEAKTWFKDSIDDLSKATKPWTDSVAELWNDVSEKLKEANLGEAWNEAYAALEKNVTELKDKLKAKVSEKFSEVFEGLDEKLAAKLGEAFGFLTEFDWGEFFTLQSEKGSNFAENVGTEIAERIKEGLKNAKHIITEVIPEIAQAIIDAFANFDFAQAGRNMMGSIKNGVRERIDGVGEWFGGIKTAFGGGAESGQQMGAAANERVKALRQNIQKSDNPTLQESTINDSRDQSQTNNNAITVNQTVNQVVEAAAAVANAVGSAAASAVSPPPVRGEIPAGSP